MLSRFLPYAAAALCSMSAAPLLAHHGSAAYDRETAVSIDATIESFSWENPHALIRLQTHAADGSIEEWAVETAGLVILARVGWNRDTLKTGDRCTVTGFPARNGSHTMILRSVVLEDGRELTSYIP